MVAFRDTLILLSVVAGIVHGEITAPPTTTLASTIFTTTTTSTTTSTTTASAIGQTQYGQCGGLGWSGLTICLPGLTCVPYAAPYFYTVRKNLALSSLKSTCTHINFQCALSITIPTSTISTTPTTCTTTAPATGQTQYEQCGGTLTAV